MKNPFKKKSKEEIFLENIPNINPILKANTLAAFKRLSDNTYTEDSHGNDAKLKDTQLLLDVAKLSVESQTKSIAPSFGMSARTEVGYAAGGSQLRRMYPDDNTRHAFLAEAYWAAAKSRKELFVECDRDSYSLVANSKVSQKSIKLINSVLEDLNVQYWRNYLRDTLVWCGDVVMRNEYTKQGGLVAIKPLLMANTAPVFYPNKDELAGWRIYQDGKPKLLPYNPADHIKTYNARTLALGSSVYTPIEVEIEAALQAAIYNNNLMAKGGLLSVVFRMKSPEGGFVNDRSVLSLAEEFTKWIGNRFKGVRGSGQFAFLPMVDGVDVLNKIGELDGAWRYLDESVARKTALMHGLDPARIGIPKTSQYENKEMVTDTLALSFDNNNYYYQRLIDEYLTNLIIRDGLGIDNVVIESAGEFSSISKVAAETCALIANFGVDFMTVNTALTDVFHMKPLDGPLGDKFLGEFLRKDSNPGEDPALTKAIGAAKLFIPEYRSHRAELIRHRRKDIRFY